jgi:hypothetical protein
MGFAKKVALLAAATALTVIAACSILQSAPAGNKAGARKIINLDGAWEVAEGSMDSPPASFAHKVPVPGLVDMAEPAFAEVGKKSDKRQAFWYRRTFAVKAEIQEVAILKIHKARYGTKVFLNGQVVGEHLPCFTPALINVKKFLKGAGRENELVIRLGADRADETQMREIASWGVDAMYSNYPDKLVAALASIK